MIHKTLLFYGLGLLFSLIPFALTIPSDRLLIWAGLGASGFLSELFTIKNKQEGKLENGCKRVLFYFNTILSLIFFIPSLFFFCQIENRAKIFEKNVTKENTVLVNVPTDAFFVYSPLIRLEKNKNWPEHFYCLYAGIDTMKLKRIDKNTLLVEIKNGWFAKQLDQWSISKQYFFKKGDSIKMQFMTAIINSVTTDGRPRKVYFIFKKDLTLFRWIQWSEKGLIKWNLPKIGEEIQLKAASF